MATLTLQQVSKLLSKQAISKISPTTAIATTGIKAGKAISKEVFGFDFVGLIIKLVVFFAIGYLSEIFIKSKIAIDNIIRNPDTPMAVATGFFGISGIVFNYLYNTFKTEKEDPVKADPVSSDFWNNEKIKQLFSENGFHGFNYWSIIKIIAVLLVVSEFTRYLKTNKDLGGKASPFTVGIFTILIIALGLTTVPDLIKRIKTTDFNLEALR